MKFNLLVHVLQSTPWWRGIKTYVVEITLSVIDSNILRSGHNFLLGKRESVCVGGDEDEERTCDNMQHLRRRSQNKNTKGRPTSRVQSRIHRRSSVVNLLYSASGFNLLCSWNILMHNCNDIKTAWSSLDFISSLELFIFMLFSFLFIHAGVWISLHAIQHVPSKPSSYCSVQMWTVFSNVHRQTHCIPSEWAYKYTLKWIEILCV